jgi:transposase
VRARLRHLGARRRQLTTDATAAVYAAAADPAGVSAQRRPGALERAVLALGDWHDTRQRLAATEARMVAVLDEELGLAELVMSIAGLTPAGAAAILAETGGPHRFATPRSMDWHAGLCPDNASGGYQGKTSISGRGRPGLRVAASRVVWAALPNNPVLAVKFTHLTTRDDNRLARQQARAACAAALLRWIHVVITRQVRWDPVIVAGGTRRMRTAA